MSGAISDSVRKLIPKGMKPGKHSNIKVDGGTYHVVNVVGRHSGGQSLIWNPKKGQPRVIQSGNTIVPLDASIPPKHRKTILSAMAKSALEATPSLSTRHKLLWAHLHPQIRSAVMDEIKTASGATPDLNQRVYVTAEACVGTLITKNVPGTSNGVLACAWAINEVVRRATGQTISKELLSTDDIFAALRDQGRGIAIQQAPAGPGSIIISPTVGPHHGHVGIVGENSLIYSNSSNAGVFGQNYTIPSWRRQFAAIQTYFFNLNPADFG